MDRILNITNGDCAVNVLQQAGRPGVFLPWRDVLHEGPVPRGLSLEDLSELRAQFIISRGWGKPENIKASFIERDNTLKSFSSYDRIILWFEHDLYDQLQILQILDWFAQIPSLRTPLSIICTEQYLGMITAEQVPDLLNFEQPISREHLQLANKSWAAFCSASPEPWQALLDTDTSALPFLNDAIIRLLDEYPDCSNGLSRTQQQALKIIMQGEQRPGKVFHCYQESEPRKFMGDSSFWFILNELLASEPPLLSMPLGHKLTMPSSPEQELTMTAMGEKVFNGVKNWLEIVALDRWIGGVHLKSDNIWCRETTTGLIKKRS